MSYKHGWNSWIDDLVVPRSRKGYDYLPDAIPKD